MVRPFSSLRARLILLVLLAMVPVLGLLLYTASEQRQLAIAETQQETLRLARLASSNQQRLIEGARQLLTTFARLPQVREGDPSACSALMADILEQHPIYANFGVAARNGGVRCSAVPLSSPVNVADRAYFQQALVTRAFAVGDYQIGRITGKATVNFGYPLLDAEGRVAAVVFAALDLAWLNQLAANSQLPAGATLTVIDRNGVILSRYPDPERWIGRSVREAPLVMAIVERHEGVTEAPGIDGVQRLYAFAPLGEGAPAGHVFVSIGIPTEVAFADANRLLARNLAALGAIAALALAAAWLVGDALVIRRVDQLVHAAARLGAGDLGARAGPRATAGADEISVLATAFNRMAAALEQREADLRQANEELRAAYDATIEGWSLALDLRDRETEGHSRRVTEMTLRLAQAMGVSTEELVDIRRGALLHDIGKMGVPDAILLKAGPLSDEEWRIMRAHPTYAYRLLSPIAFLRHALDIPYCHHERWDGSGYPRGLAGAEIPLAARIFAVVDVWDALRSNRPYRKGLPDAEWRAIIRAQAGTHFDPRVVAAFLELIDEPQEEQLRERAVGE
ncbi:MAG TPA: HD domain-containing phosphohydrolase [Roseiflexaceae bacterium]|nr:HD domain-containing phosphohydrolase [Roseiflexaceae bacterium]